MSYLVQLLDEVEMNGYLLRKLKIINKKVQISSYHNLLL